MTTFTVGDRNPYEVIFMQKGMKVRNTFYHYNCLCSIDYSYYDGSARILIKINEHINLRMTKEIYDKFRPVFLEHMENYYSGKKSKNEQLDRIEKKLDDLFYAPEMTGYQEAKTDFEEKTLVGPFSPFGTK